jgi:hypothetical protein
MYTPKYKQAERNNFPSRQLVRVTWLFFFLKKGDQQKSISLHGCTVNFDNIETFICPTNA